MCLGIPGRVVEIHDDAGLRMATVDFGGIRREVCLSCTPEADVGSYVIVHVGFAITQVDVTVAHGTPCLGPVTHAGCGALCPAYGRGCFGCFGPSGSVNLPALIPVLRRDGMDDEAVMRFLHTFNAASFDKELNS
ncbi:HypC/HybG/HupF family hydrogenase formation chaperone [Streptomyces griseorubiginosus]|uniref:HypC/HybG/HupF family hydrogenase formation chaperone n=1 Tax=Streptomyces griseorubiginosus TaxID=67304 RepID=UPI0036A854F8